MIMSFIEFLDEARSHPELNPKVSMMARIEPYRKAGYYITYTKLNKVGINPVNEFGTPIGVYCYPIKPMWTVVATNSVPFASERPFVSILHKKNGKMLDYRAKESDVKRCHAILVKKYGLTSDLKDACSIRRAGDSIFYEPTTPWGKIWAMARNAAHIFVEGNANVYKVGEKRQITTKWASIMRKDLGYIGAQDLRGEGTIHPNEPCQAVFFSTDAYEIVGTFDNRRFKDDALFNSGNRKKSEKAEGWKTSPMDLAAEAFGKCCKAKAPSMFVPYGVGNASRFSVEENGGKYVLKNMGFKKTYADLRNGGMTFEKCVFSGDADLSKMEFDRCVFAEAGRCTISRSTLKKCVFAISSISFIESIRNNFLNNGSKLNPAECKIYVERTSYSSEFNPREFKMVIDCAELVKRNPEFKKLVGNPKLFFKCIENIVNERVIFSDNHAELKSTKDIMDLLCNTSTVDDERFSNAMTVANALDECGFLGRNFNEDDNVFLPNGVSASKMQVVRDANTLVLKNIGFTNLEFNPKAGFNVIFENCVFVPPHALDNVTLRKCTIIEVSGMSLSKCNLQKCTFVSHDVLGFSFIAGGAGKHGNKVDVKETEFYIAAWRRDSNPFKPSSTDIHLTYAELVEAMPQAKQYSSDIEKFIRTIYDSMDEYAMRKGVNFPNTKSGLLHFLSASAGIEEKDEFKRVVIALMEYGNLDINDSNGLFVPHGVSGKKKIKIDKSDDGNSIIVMNCGFDGMRFKSRTGKNVQFVNCTFTSDNAAPRYDGVVFRECTFADMSLQFFTKCKFFECVCVTDSLYRLEIWGFASPLESGCRFNIKDLDLYIGDWKKNKPAFNPSSCGMHLTYDSLVKAQPKLTASASDVSTFMAAIGTTWMERQQNNEKEPETTKEFLDVISRD